MVDSTKTDNRERLVVIGNGMAAGRVLEELFERERDRYRVTVFNAEPRVNYNRIMLSPVLSGEKTYEEILIHDDAWYAANGVELIRGEKVIAINRDERKVISAVGTVADYDRLIVATGSQPFIIPVPGHDLDGVLTYRDLDDVEAMLAAAEKGGRAVVIGGGLLGLEAAAGLKARGMDVTVLHLMPTLMERQLDQSAGYLLQKAIEARGIEVVTRANTHEIAGAAGAVRAVRLDDGREIPADIVVMAVGIKPNVDLAKDAGLEVNRGLLVDDLMRTSDPAIYAVGECVEHRGQCYGLVAPLYEMAKTVGAGLAGDDGLAYRGSLTATKLKVTGVDLYSAGELAEGDDREEIVLRDAAHSIYKRLVLQENRIIGAVLYGDTADGPWFFQHIKNGTDISEMRETLIFGQGFAGAGPLDPMAAVAALPDDAEICGCNGVCKSRIVSAIEGGQATLDGVRATTKASSSCGSCTGLVEQLLELSLGGDFARAVADGMCPCTDLGHGEVRRLIAAKELMSIPAVMQELQWKTSCGCAKCRPALNYYLLATWPGIYVDDQQSRFINERVHANIQKDGTYSVVPRMWGGITNPTELRAIADVADKFAIPTVKVTGGQRIDLLGVKKEDLPAVWADLNAAGLVSGHAYGKALRTVKTCVGNEWCRFGTQASVSLGVQMERFLWGAWTPHKVKMAVSGCPRNCAEATVKDFGVVCVDSGFELHFAGAAGMEVKATQLLCKVVAEEDVLEHCAALLQLYRQEAHYLDRMHKWLARVGMDHVQAAVVEDADNRRDLYERFVFSQRFAQSDPWSERAAGRDSHEFTPLEGPKLEAVT
ncbi:nitrite reductase large subunit NirB [Minwuia thermotolerans]|uniref:nitrite reductase large subunit NirB n=1 Tax=Minwuia thermotolerans TaxID=2056226 RepID=UPI000D6DC515|nr:nitrite reductase large subunit NirB [Minwuia thermotolerans]